MQFKQPGPWLYAVGMIGLGIVNLTLVRLWSAPPAPGWWMLELVLVVAGACLLFRRTGLVAGGALALFWLVVLLRSVPNLLAAPAAFPLWVSAAQALTFAVVAAAFVRPRLWLAARIALGLTVALFGGIHVMNPEIVASLLPGWFPVPGLWPYVTGSIQIGAGIMILIGFRAQLLAFAVGLMWLSWIPLVHLPRLMASPGSAFEWTFMITALALAGAAWSVGERITAKPGEDLQASAH